MKRVTMLVLLLLVGFGLLFAVPALAVDEFAGRPEVSKLQPATDWVAITPHDTNELPYVCRAVWVGGAGNIKMTGSGSGTETFYGAAAGTMIPARPKVVFSTGTTATNLLCVR